MIVRTVDTLRRVSAHVFALKSSASLACLAGACLLSIGQALAAPINYGDFAGTTVMYTQVTEDSNSGDTPPLFGPPTVNGNSLDFDPVGFSASATGAGGVDVTDGNLRFGVMANAGHGIPTIQLTEAGDTTLAGFGTDATFTAVLGHGVLNINAVDGVGINSISVPFSMTFSPSGGTYGLLTDGGGGPLYSVGWSGGISLDINGILASNNVPFNLGATKISVNLDNTLVALSEEGTFSLIAKKDFGGLTFTVIPEPSAMLLVGLASIGLVFARRK